jgi:hypothetical protein
MPAPDRESLDLAEDYARQISLRDQCDIFIYNGVINSTNDLEFMYCVNENKKHDKCRLLLITSGGDADAAYKMARYLQERYKHLECLISGKCKSAGTLVAIGAHELIFSAYGEIGPLDVQLEKKGRVQSGLNIFEALKTIEDRAKTLYFSTVLRAVGVKANLQNASRAASDLIGALYGPILAKFDPDDVGHSFRSMRIAIDYGKRLDMEAQNLKPAAVEKLAETFCSHSFVIDRREAKNHFRNVRHEDKHESELIGHLKDWARWQTSGETIIRCLSVYEQSEQADAGSPSQIATDPQTVGTGSDGTNGKDSYGTVRADSPKVKRAKSHIGRSSKSDFRSGSRDRPVLSLESGFETSDDLVQRVFEELRRAGLDD